MANGSYFRFDYDNIVVYYLYHTIVVCLSTTRGINDKSRVDVRLAVL